MARGRGALSLCFCGFAPASLFFCPQLRHPLPKAVYARPGRPVATSFCQKVQPKALLWMAGLGHAGSYPYLGVGRSEIGAEIGASTHRDLAKNQTTSGTNLIRPATQPRPSVTVAAPHSPRFADRVRTQGVQVTYQRTDEQGCG